VTAVDVDRLAALRDERDFLLRSLDDLDREHAAGDVDDHDYEVLRDDYTARAAAVLRSIDAGTDGGVRARAPLAGRGRAAIVVGGVLVFALLAGLLVARAAGRRDPGEVATGGIGQSATEMLNEAGRRAGDGDIEGAIELYDEVLEGDPGNAEALTYKSWLQTLGGDAGAGLDGLLAAATAHPEYPDVHAFLAIVFFRNGLVAQADRELDRLDALDPPPAIRDLTESLRSQIDDALASTTTGDQEAGGAR
jgi:tetratricopeptide (TPR) repeat protein